MRWRQLRCPHATLTATVNVGQCTLATQLSVMRGAAWPYCERLLVGVELDDVFTTDMASTPLHVVKWGFLGESWPFFRPNFVNMEDYRTENNVDEVAALHSRLSQDSDAHCNGAASLCIHEQCQAAHQAVSPRASAVRSLLLC